MEVMSNGSFEDLITPRCYCPPNSPRLNFVEFFASLIILLTVCGCKIDMGPLPGMFVTVPVALNYLSIILTVNMAILTKTKF